MNDAENKTACCPGGIDASCRVPLLALFGGAALWLVLGLLLGLAAAMSFHAPDMFADCPYLNYGHAQAAANDLLLYGFAIPAALGVLLWIFARLSQAPLALPIVPVVAANLWHLGVLVGTVGIMLGDSTGHAWLEYPRPAAVLLFTAFMLIAVSAAATMGFRAKRELYPAHWFLFAALLWFAWAYSTANLFLVSNHPPRGVVQAIIAWWFANNLLFVGLGLLGVGIAFYFLPKLAGQPLAGTGYAMFAFFTFIVFGAWCGIPPSAPVPAWLPSISTYAAMLTVLPIIALAIVIWRTVASSGFKMSGTPFCYIRFGTMSFLFSSLLYLGEACPHGNRLIGFTWFNFGVSQWQLLGFMGMLLTGAIYEILPRIMEKELPYPKLARLNFYLFMTGVLLYVIPLLVGGIMQGLRLRNGSFAFADVSAAALMWLRVSSLGQLLMLFGALCLLLNIFSLTIRWKLGLLRGGIAAVKAPLEVRIMKTGFGVFLAAFFAFGASWVGFVYAPVQQLGGARETIVLQSSDNWPQQRTGEATLGLQVYRAYGCAACHTEQIRQSRVTDDLVVISLGSHQAGEFKDYVKSLLFLPELMNSSNAIVAKLDRWNGQLPVTLYSGNDTAAVSALAEKLKSVSVKAEPRVMPVGADIARGWGVRQSVAADYLYDEPVQLGSLRAGPDLSTIGVRMGDVNLQLKHLYAPRSVKSDSTMPAYRMLFEVRKLGARPSPDAITLPKEFAPAEGMEVVPTTEARQLAAYLVSLKNNAPLYEAPFTPVTAAK